MENGQKFFTGQHAYRKFHSTTTCLVELTDHIFEEIDNGNLVGLVSTDLSKAFDTLSHDLLLSKLGSLGVGRTALTWFHSYLSDRVQRVNLGDYKSTETKIEAGVPQGSILGPVLFIAFTSDFHTSLNDCKVKAYADDTQILVTAKTVEELQLKIEETIKGK